MACNPTSLEGIEVESVCVDPSFVSPNRNHYTMSDDNSDPRNNNNSTPTRGRPNAVAWAGQLAHSAGQTVQAWTVRRYALPDKHVASQVLMYRQLLHTKCRPGLTLSREYQGTPAQRAVKDMPWWCLGVEETRKMVISYDDLLKRLWVGGACKPWQETDCMLTEDEKAPVPHAHWVDRLGFQQTDPVTDFRSGGVLSLAMMVHLVEACPDTHARFVRPNGEASVLPFGITSINITDMMARFLMLSKAVDRMDALLSQKPFWRMFADPYALLVCQQVSMDVTADVVVELQQERGRVTVFDFAEILKIVEDRVERDLLGAGPKSVDELRTLYQRNKQKYQRMLNHRLGRKNQGSDSAPPSGGLTLSAAGAVAEANNSKVEATAEVSAAKDAPETRTDEGNTTSGGGQRLRQSVWNQATSFRSQASKVAGSASNFAGNVFQKIKAPGFAAVQSQTTTEPPGEPEIPDLLSGSPPSKALADPVTTGNTDAQVMDSTTMDILAAPASAQAVSDDEDWAQVVTPVTDAVSNFSIGGDDDDEDL